MLFQLGPLQVNQTFNAHETAHEYGGDYAAKNVIGTRKPREFVGVGDETFNLTGTIFPAKLGGLDELGLLQAMVEAGEPQILVRGDGTNLGWYTVDKGTEKSKFIDSSGVGRVIDVEIKLTRVDAPSAENFTSFLIGLF
jgi:uncharacterized protein